jgi:hypothetical protein
MSQNATKDVDRCDIPCYIDSRQAVLSREAREKNAAAAGRTTGSFTGLPNAGGSNRAITPTLKKRVLEHESEAAANTFGLVFRPILS